MWMQQKNEDGVIAKQEEKSLLFLLTSPQLNWDSILTHSDYRLVNISV